MTVVSLWPYKVGGIALSFVPCLQLWGYGTCVLTFSWTKALAYLGIPSFISFKKINRYTCGLFHPMFFLAELAHGRVVKCWVITRG